MFPGGRSSQNPPGYPSPYRSNVSAVSNPSWFQPTPVPPPSQYAPPRADTGRDLLAESYERMRNEMRSLQGSSSLSKYDAGPAAPPPPAMEEKPNPISQLLENKDVSLSSLLEAAMDPSIGSSKRTEDPIMKKTILDKCEGKIAQLYRLRISGQGLFFPMTEPKSVKFDGDSTLTYNHPRIEFNMVPEKPLWTCPDVVVEKKIEEGLKKESSDEVTVEDPKSRIEKDKEMNSNPSKPMMRIEAVEPLGRVPITSNRPTGQPQTLPSLLQLPQPLLSNQAPLVDVSMPPLVQYPARDLSMLAHAPSTLTPLPLEIWTEIEKERRRKEIESEWDRLMQDKQRKEKKQKKKKRKRSRSRSSSGSSSSKKSSRSHSRNRRSKSRRTRSRSRRRSRSRYRSRSRGRRSSSYQRARRSRGRSGDRRFRHKSRSISLSPSPTRRDPMSPFRMSRSPRRLRRSPSPRIRRISPPRPLLPEYKRHSPQHRRYSPPRPREEYPLAPPQPYPYPAGPPPNYNNFYGPGPGPVPYQPQPDPPPPGMDYGPPMVPGPLQYGPMGPGPGPWMDPSYGPPGGSGPWMGPAPAAWFGPRGPMPPRMQGPLGPRVGPFGKQKPPPQPKVKDNLIDLTSRAATTQPAPKKPVIVVDITDDNDKGSTPDPENKRQDTKGESKASKEYESKTVETEPPKPVDKAKVITTIVPPGVSPERETHTKYPNVESEFTRPMRTQFRKSLEPLEKVLDKIRLYQRDSFDFKTLIKSLEAGKIEFMGVHTLHDGLLCKLEINRKHPDKFFKIVLPPTHIGRFLRVLHQTYHDYSIGRVQRLVDDLFCDPHEFPLTKIISTFKMCKKCIEQEEKEREELRERELLILSSPEMGDLEGPRDKSDEHKTRKVRHRSSDKDLENRGKRKSLDKDLEIRDRKKGSDKDTLSRDKRESLDKKRQKEVRRSRDGERGSWPRRDSERERKEKSNNQRGGSKIEGQKSPGSQGAETYSKFEDLSVSNDEKKRRHSDENDKKGSKTDKVKGEVAKKSQGGRRNGKLAASSKKAVSQDEAPEKSKEGPEGDTNASDEGGEKKEGVGSTMEPHPKTADPEPKPTKPAINPDDFKERVRAVQMAVDPLRSHISDLEALKKPEPGLLLKAGMLCRRLTPPKGQKPEVKIVVTPPCLKQMVEIVHTMAVLHAPYQKTVTVFNKHFVPIDGLEQVVSEVLNSCEKCSKGSAN